MGDLTNGAQPRALVSALWAAAVLLVVFFLAPKIINLNPGLFYFPDGERYRSAAQMLLGNGFRYRTVFAAFETSYAALPFAAGYITLVALLMGLLGSHYGIAIFIIGISLMATGLGLLAAELARRTGAAWTGWVFPLVLGLSPNVTYHIKPVLTDAIFSGLYLMSFWAALRYCVNRRTGYLLGLLALSCVCVFVRASGPAALGAIVVVLMFRTIPDQWWSGARFLVLLAGIVGAMLSGVAAVGALSLHTGLLPFKPDGLIMQITPEDIGRYLNQSDYQLPDPEDLGGYLRVFAARVNVFFDLTMPYYSLRHNLFRVATYGAMYLGLIAGIVMICRGRTHPEIGRAFAIGLLYILAIPFFRGAVHMLDTKGHFFMYVEGVLLWVGILGAVLAWRWVKWRRIE